MALLKSKHRECKLRSLWVKENGQKLKRYLGSGLQAPATYHKSKKTSFGGKYPLKFVLHGKMKYCKIKGALD